MLHRLTTYESAYVISLFNYYLLKVNKYREYKIFGLNHARDKQKLQLW